MVELGEHCHTHIIPRLNRVVDGQDATGVTEATGCVIVTVVVAEPTAPSLSVTLTCTTAVPAAPYACVAAMGDAWLAVVPVVCTPPSPQSIAYDQGASFLPGSANVAFSAKGAPVVTVWLGPAFTVGVALAIVTVVVTGALAAPRASVTVSVAV